MSGKVYFRFGEDRFKALYNARNEITLVQVWKNRSPDTKWASFYWANFWHPGSRNVLSEGSRGAAVMEEARKAVKK